MGWGTACRLGWNACRQSESLGTVALASTGEQPGRLDGGIGQISRTEPGNAMEDKCVNGTKLGKKERCSSGTHPNGGRISHLHSVSRYADGIGRKARGERSENVDSERTNTGAPATRRRRSVSWARWRTAPDQERNRGAESAVLPSISELRFTMESDGDRTADW